MRVSHGGLVGYEWIGVNGMGSGCLLKKLRLQDGVSVGYC